MLKDKRLAIIGAGNMGETLIKGLLAARATEAGQIIATAAHRERVEYLAEKYGVAIDLDNLRAAHAADVVLMAVKPQKMAEVLDEIKPALVPDKLLISIAASVTIASIEAKSALPIPVIRAMPNTPCLIRHGMTALAAGRHARPEHLDLARALFEAVGRTVVVEEKHMDAVTGLSASGPAFIYIVIESLAEAGVKTGLPRDLSRELAAQAVLGAAAMVLETGEHPAMLKDLVTTPAGCTIDGILELEEGKLRVTLIKAVVRAAERARQLVAQS